ncbi:putative glutamate receptor [Oratosquilla oratoria]|uniref:putative glutamate receptor n=1 Tax=Oratosquilla oratoria TaxID=337810 RepID=UPI003F766459
MSLSGRVLRVGAEVWVPWVDLTTRDDGTLEANGVAVDAFNIIAKKLNFTYHLVRPGDGEWGRGLPNGSFTGMIGMCQRKEVDMALGPFGVTWERAQVVDFSTTLFVDGFGIFLPRPRLQKDLSGFLKPLSWEVWLGFLTCLLLGAFLGALLLLFHNYSFLTWKGVKAFNSGWMVRGVLQQAIPRLPRVNAGRVFVGTWILVGLILGAAYRGVLTSLLAVPRVTVPVDSLEDLLDYGRIPWALEYGTSLHQLFADADSGVYSRVFQDASFVKDCYRARHKIKDDNLAVLCDFFTMRKIMSEDFSVSGQCNYYIAENAIKSAPLSFAFPRTSPLIQHFDQWLQPLKESGVMSRSVLSVTANATACLVRPGREKGTRVNTVFDLVDLAGVFLLLVGGLVAALIAFLCEEIGAKLMD